MWNVEWIGGKNQEKVVAYTEELVEIDLFQSCCVENEEIELF